MSRSKWKGPYLSTRLLKNKTLKDRSKELSRSSTIMPFFVGKIYEIHNGLKRIPLKVTSSMIGYKFGEFLMTKKVSRYNK